MVVHHHELEIPPDLHVASVGDIALVHGAAERELVISIHPVTQLSAKRWIRTTLVDGPVDDARYTTCLVGAHRCERVTIDQPKLRRVIVFVETRDGSNGWLPLVLACTDDRHDQLFDTMIASLRATRSHPLSMWID